MLLFKRWIGSVRRLRCNKIAKGLPVSYAKGANRTNASFAMVSSGNTVQNTIDLISYMDTHTHTIAPLPHSKKNNSLPLLAMRL